MYRMFINIFLLCCVASGAPVITFDRNLNNFGIINEKDGKVSCKFVFVNSGDMPLKLKNVESSCGCAVADWSEAEIVPGDSGVIAVTFNPAGRSGPFNKTIKIYSNASNEMSVLRLIGEVNSPQLKDNRREQSGQPGIVLVTFVSDPVTRENIETKPDGSYKLEEISKRRHQLSGTAEGFIEIDKRLVLFSEQVLDDAVRAAVMSSGTDGLVAVNNTDEGSEQARVFGEISEGGEPKPLQGVLISMANPLENTIQNEIIPDGVYRIEETVVPNYQISGSVSGTLRIIKKIQLVPGHPVTGYIKGKLTRGSLSLKKSGLIIYAEDQQGALFTTRSENDGSFEFSELNDGEYTLRVADSQYIFPEETIDIFSGSGVKNVVMDASFGQISGKITDQTNGTAVANAEIVLEQSPGTYGLPMTPIRMTVKSDSKGVYSIDDLGQGMFQIQIVAAGFGTACENVLISRDQMKVRQDVSLTREATVSGNIGGVAIDENLHLLVFSPGKKAFILCKSVVNPDGTFNIQGLESGSYKILLSSSEKYTITKNFTCNPGQNKTVSIQFKSGKAVVSGSIKTGGNQSPVGNAIIIAESAAFSCQTRSNADGSYTLLNLPAGDYSLQVVAKKYDIMTRKKLRVKDNETQSGINFLLTPAL